MFEHETKIKEFLEATKQQPLGLTFLTVVVFSLFSGIVLEKNLVLLIKSYQSYLFIDFFRLITVVGDATWWLIIFVLGLSITILGLKFDVTKTPTARLQRYKSIFWYLILSCLVSGVLHHILKILIGRFRPRYLFSQDLYGFSPLNFDIAMNSFPSGHSQTIFSICMCLSIIYPRYLTFFLLLAVMVGISRIVLLAHFPSDVIFGAYLGIVTAILLNRYYFRLPLFEQK